MKSEGYNARKKVRDVRRMLRELVRTVRKIHNAGAADNPDLDGPIY